MQTESQESTDVTAPIKTTVMKKFRSGRRRIDFYPDGKIIDWIEKLKRQNPQFTTNHILNDLLRSGVEQLFPEDARKTWGS